MQKVIELFCIAKFIPIILQIQPPMQVHISSVVFSYKMDLSTAIAAKILSTRDTQTPDTHP